MSFVRTSLALAVAGAAALLVPLAPSAAAVEEGISAHVATADPQVDKTLTIEGDVTGAPMYPATVNATRDDSQSSGTPVGMVMTDDQGHFTLDDTPPARGTVTYHLSADGGAATKDVVTHVAGKPTALAIHVQPRLATVGDQVHVLAHLDSATTSRNVTIYAKPYRRAGTTIDSGPVDANGDRATDFPVQRRTTFIVSFAGDATYAPASDSAVAKARALIDEKLRGGYATRHGYRLYHRRARVDVFVHMRPESKGRCLVMRAQRHYSGSWHNTTVSDCGPDAIRTDSSGEKIAQLQPPHVLGQHYRVRAEWHGNRAIARRNGPWRYLEFHR